MGAAYISQQFLQNVLGYSTLAAGAAILPAGIFMVLVAPRSAKLVGLQGSRRTLLTGQALLLVAFVFMLLFWKEDISYWVVAIPYVFLGAGVGLAGTPSSNSLTGSVPVTRVGMASGTADLQRDLGGALMTSIFGALLTAGYASAMGTAIAESGKHITDSTQATLQLSYASAEDLAAQHPQYASQITAAAQSSFLKGDQWAYLAAIVAILIGMALVYRFFPKKDAEEALRASYHAAAGGGGEGAGGAPADAHPGAGLGQPWPVRDTSCRLRSCDDRPDAPCSPTAGRSRSSRAGTSPATTPSSTWSRPRRTRSTARCSAGGRTTTRCTRSSASS